MDQTGWSAFECCELDVVKECASYSWMCLYLSIKGADPYIFIFLTVAVVLFILQ